MKNWNIMLFMETRKRHLHRSLQIILVTAGLFVSLVGCTYHNIQELLPPVSTCDSLHPSYAADIEPILRTQCYSCHDTLNATAGIILQLHSNVVVYALNGRLVNSLVQPDTMPSTKYMPPSSKLSPCELGIFRNWVANGAPNN
jgi:hypothetical protein